MFQYTKRPSWLATSVAIYINLENKKTVSMFRCATICKAETVHIPNVTKIVDGACTYIIIIIKVKYSSASSKCSHSLLINECFRWGVWLMIWIILCIYWFSNYNSLKGTWGNMSSCITSNTRLSTCFNDVQGHEEIPGRRVRARTTGDIWERRGIVDFFPWSCSISKIRLNTNSTDSADALSEFRFSMLGKDGRYGDRLIYFWRRAVALFMPHVSLLPWYYL